jgi:transcriptional regulator with XRE-family HTH domain
MSVENINIILAAQLEAIRNASGITQTELAKRLEVTPQMVSYLEKAGADTRLSVLANWAASLGLEPALVPARRRTLIVDSDDTVVVLRQLHKHALITGPDRVAAARAILELRAGARFHHGAGLNSFVPADSVELERLEARLFVDGDASGSVIVDSDVVDHDLVRRLLDDLDLIGWQRWTVVLLAADRSSVPDDVTHRIVEHLHAENANVSRCRPDNADPEELLPLGRLTEVLGTKIPGNSRTDGVLLGEDAEGNPVFLDLDELLKHTSIVGDRDLRRPAARSIVAGLLDAGWDATVVNLDDGRDDAASRDWMRTYAEHHDVRYQELTLRPGTVPAKLDPYTGTDAEALTALIMASQEFEAPYYQAAAELVVGQAVRLLHAAYHAGVRDFPPTLSCIGNLLISDDLPATARDLLERARSGGATIDESDVETLLRPEKATLESGIGCGARLVRIADSPAARNLLVDTLDGETTLDLSSRGVTYIGLDSWGQPELTDFVLAAVTGRTLDGDDRRGHAGSIRRVVLIEGAESAREDVIVELLGRARGQGVSVILSGNASSERGRVPGDPRDATPEQHRRRLQNVNVRIAVGERRDTRRILETFGLTDEEKAGLPEPQDGYAVLLVIKPSERFTTVKVRTRKPHETLR